MEIAAPALASVLISPWILGAGILRFCRLRFADDRLAFVAWSWMSGALATALGLFVWFVAGLPPSAFPWVLPIAGVVTFLASGAALRRRAGSAAEPEPALPPACAGGTAGRIFFAVSLGAALFVAVVCIARVNGRAIAFADEGDIWSAKAKSIYLGGGLGDGFVEIVTGGAVVQHPDYPLLNPLLQAWVFLNAGDVTHVVNRLPLQMSAIALLLLLAAAARRAGGPWLGGAAALMLATSLETRFAAFSADADVLVAFGLLAALDARSRFDGLPNRRFQCAYAIALAFLVWSKNEGMMLALCVVVADLAVRAVEWRRGSRAAGDAGRGLVPFLLPLVPAACVVALQAGFNSWHRLSNDLLFGAPGGSLLERLIDKFPRHAPAILDHLNVNLVERGANMQFVPLVFFALVLVLPDRLLRPSLLRASGAVLLGACGYLLIYLTTPHDIEWHLRLSMSRLVFQLLPSMLVVVVAASAQELAAARAIVRPGPSGARPEGR